MLDRADVYQKREKKGKTLKQMFFGNKFSPRNKTSMEALEEEQEANKRRDESKTDEELDTSVGEKKGRRSKL